MKKREKIISALVIAIACIIFAVIFNFVIPNIQNRDWVLAYAQKTDPYFAIVAHGADYDFSDRNDPMYISSKPVELTLTAKGGKLRLTDKTNGKTYLGTYESSGSFGSRRGVPNRRYNVVIDGIEGTAYFSSTKTLLLSIDGYYLTFEIDR